MIKIVVIQPPGTGDPQNKKIAEFNLNMSQFSVVDKVDFFKQISELIYSNMISNNVTKGKSFRDFKKLERKLKTEKAKKKALQNKRSELEKKILEIKKGDGNDAFNNSIQDKDIEIQNLKKKLKCLMRGSFNQWSLNLSFKRIKFYKLSFKIIRPLWE